MFEKRLQTVQRPESRDRILDMFHSVAKRYDLANTVMSFGRHYAWKDFVAEQANLREGSQALDCCAGTMDVTLRLARRVGKSGHVWALDMNSSMLAVGEMKLAQQGLSERVTVIQGDAHVPDLPEESLDAVTIATSARHLYLDKAFQNWYRLLKPGGRLVILEFYLPRNKAIRSAYDLYSYTLMPKLATWITHDKTGVYYYLPDSIRVFYSPNGLKELMEDCGFKNVRYHPLTFNVAGVHVGEK